MRSWLRRSRPAVEPRLEAGQLRAAWQSVSLLLGYPDETLRGQLPVLAQVAGRLPEDVGEPLSRLVDWLGATEWQAVQKGYVETFDYTRKCALHLTYFAHGDTRKRGVALVQFKQAYRRAGLEITDDELPDHLSVVLEFGASGDADIAWRLLNDHRAGIEMLRLALTDRESPWLDAVLALCATLPPLQGDQAEAVARLIAEGPPNEEVGLDAYSLDPRLNPSPAEDVEFLGMPQSQHGLPITTGARS